MTAFMLSSRENSRLPGTKLLDLQLLLQFFQSQVFQRLTRNLLFQELRNIPEQICWDFDVKLTAGVPLCHERIIHGETLKHKPDTRVSHLTHSLNVQVLEPSLT